MNKIQIQQFINGLSCSSDTLLVSDVNKLTIEPDTLLVISALLKHSSNFSIEVRMENQVNKIVVKPVK